MPRSIAPVLAAAALAGCHAQADGGEGATVSKNYNVGNFSAIEVAGPYDVQVRTGSNASVSGTGSERLLQRTVVEVQGDKLLIHAENNHSFFHWGWGHRGKARFVVTVPQLSGATIAGSGGIKVDKITGNAFEGEIAGSGGLDQVTVSEGFAPCDAWPVQRLLSAARDRPCARCSTRFRRSPSTSG